MDFYRRSNTHDLDQDGFKDLYRRDFIHAISRVARRKLARHHLDPYQLSGPLYPNALSVLFCAFPRPASPTSSTYPVGCPSPT